METYEIYTVRLYRKVKCLFFLFIAGDLHCRHKYCGHGIDTRIAAKADRECFCVIELTRSVSKLIYLSGLQAQRRRNKPVVFVLVGGGIIIPCNSGSTVYRAAFPCKTVTVSVNNSIVAQSIFITEIFGIGRYDCSYIYGGSDSHTGGLPAGNSLDMIADSLKFIRRKGFGVRTFRMCRSHDHLFRIAGYTIRNRTFGQRSAEIGGLNRSPTESHRRVYIIVSGGNHRFCRTVDTYKHCQSRLARLPLAVGGCHGKTIASALKSEITADRFSGRSIARSHKRTVCLDFIFHTRSGIHAAYKFFGHTERYRA